MTVQAVRGRALFSGVYFNTAVHKYVFCSEFPEGQRLHFLCRPRRRWAISQRRLPADCNCWSIVIVEAGRQQPLTNPRHPLTNRPHPLTNRQHPLTNRRHPLTNRQHPLTNRRHPLTNRQHPLTNRRHPLTNRRHPLTNRRHPLTNRRHPLTNRRHPLTDRDPSYHRQQPLVASTLPANRRFAVLCARCILRVLLWQSVAAKGAYGNVTKQLFSGDFCRFVALSLAA